MCLPLLHHGCLLACVFLCPVLSFLSSFDSAFTEAPLPIPSCLEATPMVFFLLRQAYELVIQSIQSIDQSINQSINQSIMRLS